MATTAVSQDGYYRSQYLQQQAPAGAPPSAATTDTPLPFATSTFAPPPTYGRPRQAVSIEASPATATYQQPGYPQTYPPPSAPLPPPPNPADSANAPFDIPAADGDGGVASWIPVDWDSSVEIGLNGARGNSETLSIRAGADMKRKTDLHEIGFDLDYSKISDRGIETQNQALFKSTFERLHVDSPWTWFVNTGLEFDEFKAFDLRLTINSGLGYRFVDTDAEELKGRVGAGVSREFGGPDEEWKPEALFGLDYRAKLTERQEVFVTFDYYPTWDDISDYRFESDLGYEVLLDEESNLSLKLSLTDRYDSTPNGRKANDVLYSMLLLWKL